MSVHKTISLIKSGTRLIGFLILGIAFHANPQVSLGCGILFGSEIIGILEEFGEA